MALVPRTVPIPEVYVLWHPECAIGETLARHILNWLRPGIGQGPDVYYRSLPAPGKGRYTLPLPLPGEQARKLQVPPANQRTRSNHQIVVALVDENFVAELSWRYWLERLASTAGKSSRTVFPVALDATAYNMPD